MYVTKSATDSKIVCCKESGMKRNEDFLNRNRQNTQKRYICVLMQLLAILFKSKDKTDSDGYT